jgi:hypothetical protein
VAAFAAARCHRDTRQDVAFDEPDRVDDLHRPHHHGQREPLA